MGTSIALRKSATAGGIFSLSASGLPCLRGIRFGARPFSARPGSSLFPGSSVGRPWCAVLLTGRASIFLVYLTVFYHKLSSLSILSCPVVRDWSQIGEIDKFGAPDAGGFERRGRPAGPGTKQGRRFPRKTGEKRRSVPSGFQFRQPIASMSTRSILLWPSTVGWMPSGEIKFLYPAPLAMNASRTGISGTDARDAIRSAMEL